ncbi:MAG: hypothetical protein R3315_10555, partial [Woeseiaceae bacterium]|nr:hypothetical protein [Woeseiaceae bacterium]
PSTLSSRRDWLRFVVNPTFSVCGEITSTAFRHLESALQSLQHRDVESALQHWSCVRQRFDRCARSITPIHERAERCAWPELAHFLWQLRLFFTLELPASLLPEDRQHGGLGPAWQRLLSDGSALTADGQETLAAELLHTRLKWTILANRHLLIQNVPRSSAQRDG